MKKIFVVAALMAGSHTFAQTDTGTMNPVVVTANRFPQKQNTTGKVVTVITQEALLRSAGTTLPDLLNRQAGITVIGSQNNLGTNQDIFLQGAASGKSLLLVDGVPVYDPSTISNAFDINHFSIENIERIEIVRGAMSTLYGSDAVAGVINIITKKGGSRRLGSYGTLAGGSYDTYKAVAGLNGNSGTARYNLQYSHLRSAGFSSAYDSAGTEAFDRDGFQQHLVSGQFTAAVSPRVTWKVSGQAGRYRTELDAGAFMDEKDYHFASANYAAGSGLEYKYGKGMLFFNYHFNTTRRNYLDDSASVGGFAKFTEQLYTGRSHVAELYATANLTTKISLLAGTDYRAQNTDQYFSSVSSFGPYKSERGKDSTAMQQYAVYASALFSNPLGLNLELGGRYNRHSEYGSNSTFTFNPSFLFKNNIKLFANIGSAFKAPSLYQLYVVNQGTAPLDPETSRTLDGGVAYHNERARVNMRALFFLRKVENGIEYSFVDFQYFNNNIQRDRGAETEIRWNNQWLSVTANYTFVTGKVNTTKYRYDAPTFSYAATGDTTYNNLFRRPRHTVQITTGVQAAARLYISAHARFAGKRLEPIFMGTPVTLGAYHTVDLYSEYRIHRRIKIFTDLKNITNQRFFDILGYNARRFNFMAGITVNGQ